MAKDGKLLVYSVASPENRDRRCLRHPHLRRSPRPLLTGKGKYEHLTWDDKHDQLAFTGNGTSLSLEGHAAQAEEIVSAATPGFRQGFVISDRANLTFSKDGTRLFFGAAPPAPPEHAAAIVGRQALLRSLELQRRPHPAHAEGARRARTATAPSARVYIIPEHKCFQLADEEMAELVPSDNGRYALGTDDRQYRAMVEYGEHFSDSYLVDTETGKRTLLAKKHEGTVHWSADGRYALTFDGKDWNTIAVPSGKTINLTAQACREVLERRQRHARPAPRPTASPAGPRTASTSCSTITTTSGRSRPMARPR